MLASLHPDERALAALFPRNIDEPMLRGIAGADYGWMADECYALLQQILRTGLAASNEFHLREVLELTRWGPRETGVRGSWTQLFVCTALLQLASRYPEYFDGECETLAAFVSCAIDLGEAVARPAAAMLAGRYLKYPGDEVSPFLAFAILLLAAHVERREDRGPWLKDLATWVEEEERRVRNFEGGPVAHEWLLGLTFFRQFEGLWREAARRILVAPGSPHPREADEALRRLGGDLPPQNRTKSNMIS